MTTDVAELTTRLYTRPTGADLAAAVVAQRDN